MNAEQLWELVKDWPGDARSRWCRFQPQEEGIVEQGVWEHLGGSGMLLGLMETFTAAALHVVSGLEWLATDRQGIRVFQPTDDRPSWYIDDNWNPPMMVVRGPTLIEAVAAAIKACQTGGK